MADLDVDSCQKLRRRLSHTVNADRHVSGTTKSLSRRRLCQLLAGARVLDQRQVRALANRNRAWLIGDADVDGAGRSLAKSLRRRSGWPQGQGHLPGVTKGTGQSLLQNLQEAFACSVATVAPVRWLPAAQPLFRRPAKMTRTTVALDDDTLAPAMPRFATVPVW